MTEEEEIKKRTGSVLSLSIPFPLLLPLPYSSMANDNQPATFTLNIKALLSLPYRLCNPPPAVGKVRSCGVTPVFKVQLDDILDRKHLPPLGLKDFEEWLLFVEQCPENLYFILWLRDYSARYAQWSRKSLPHKKDSIRASPSVSWLTNKPLTSPSLALAYARAKQTFLTPNASYELAVPSALLAPFHTTNFGSPHPDPRVFADVAAEAQKRLKDSLRRFVTASYHNVGTYRATCGIVAGALFCIAGAVPPVVVNLVEGRSRWLRLLAVPGLWFGLTILIASLHGVCMMIYIFGDVRQLRKFELQRPAISRPKPLQNPRGVSSATAFTGSESSYTSSSGYSTRTSISRGSRRSRSSNRKAKKAHAHAKAQKINQASFVRPSPARALTGPPKISIAIPQTAVVRREAYDSYNANNGLGMGMGTTSPSVRSDTTALTATTASDSVAIPTPAMTPLGAYAYAYAYPSASAYDARVPVARGRRLSSCLNIELESVSGVTVGDGDGDLVLDEEFDQGGYSDVDVRSSRFGEDSSLSEEDEDDEDISEDEDEDEDGSYEEHGIYISRVYGPDEDEYADTDVDADGVSVIVDADVDLEAQRDSGRANNLNVGGRTMGILGIAKSFLGAAAASASAQGGERLEDEGQITTATTASTSTAVTIPTTASFIPPFPYDGEHDRVSVKSAKSAKSGRSARSRLSAKIGAGMSAGMSAVRMGGRSVSKQQTTVFDFDALPPPLAKSQQQQQQQGQGGAVNVNVISAPISEHSVPMPIPMPGQLGQEDYAIPMPRAPRAPANEKEKKTMWARFRDMLGKKQDACQECKERQRERGLKAVDVAVDGGVYDLEKQAQFQQQQSISTTPVHVTLSSNNGIDEKSGMPMPGGYQGYTYQLSPIDSEPASASTLGPPSPNPLLGTGMGAGNLPLPVVSPNAHAQTQTQIISKPSLPPSNPAQEKDKSWRTNYLTIQAVPAFGPVTRVLSPVVTRAQWEIVVRSFAVAGVVAWVVVGSLLALPEMPVGRYMTVVM